jgi:hypothetical protein
MSKRDHVADPSAKQNRISSHKCLSPSRKYQYGTRSNGAEPHHLYNHRVQDRHYTSIPFMQSEESSHSNISTEPEMKEPHRNFECCFPTKPRSTSASGEGSHKNGSSQNAQYPNAKLVTAERHLLNLHMEHIATRLSLRRKITAKSRMLAVCKRNWKRKKEKQDKGKKRKEKKRKRGGMHVGAEELCRGSSISFRRDIVMQTPRSCSSSAVASKIGKSELFSFPLKTGWMYY